MTKLQSSIPRRLKSTNRGLTNTLSGRFNGNMDLMDPSIARGDAGSMEETTERSYLSAAVESMYSWGGSRSSTPKPAATLAERNSVPNKHVLDHQTQHWHGLSRKRYPPDCPSLNARWFYAVDVAKRKPKVIKDAMEDDKPPVPPKKFVPFTKHDSQALEAAYQDIADKHDDPHKESKQTLDDDPEHITSMNHYSGTSGEVSAADSGIDAGDHNVKIPVHEDYLFDVDIGKRELSPAYWLGPVYEVRRGSWFYQEGINLRPCEENLAAQLEEGYLKVKPFRYGKSQSESTPRPSSFMNYSNSTQAASNHEQITPKISLDNLKTSSDGSKDNPPVEQQTYRLFGSYMNSIATYQDANVAFLSADTLIQRMSSTVYQRFAGGGYLGGVKLVRGFTEPKDQSKNRGARTPTNSAGVTMELAVASNALKLDERQQKLLNRRSAPSIFPSTKLEFQSEGLQGDKSKVNGDDEKTTEEQQMRHDYQERENENQARQIDHLFLVTHGIGQRLGMRTESVNFIHDVNVLRKNLKNVYEGSADLQALNSEIDKLPRNCRIQVLPICWRHLLDFPKKNVRQSRKEHDLGDIFGEEDSYPTLDEITPEGVQFVRSLISDLALDILLYQSSYRDDVIRIVLTESNRIYQLFTDRNPSFKGKVSLIGHSLGSAVFFDLLCRQSESLRKADSNRKGHNVRGPSRELEFDFEVEDFYCLGSPIGLFQMLKGRNILARHSHADARPAESPFDPDLMQDPFLAGGVASFSHENPDSGITGLPHTISSPKVRQLYNIFYPSDPISYRLEPLVSAIAAKMKPQQLPYTKKTYTAAVSGLGAKVGQSVSGLWSSFSSNIASSLLSRSLGLTHEDIARIESSSNARANSESTLGGIGVVTGGGVSSLAPPLQREDTNDKKRQLAESTVTADRNGGGNISLLIDDEIETLFAGFEKSQKIEGPHETEKDWSETQRSLRREEAKLKALNRNGRIDYSIQESVLDFNPISSIASHLGYWADEDVAHFLMSMSLSHYRAGKSQK